jgi:ATP-dependent DNA helicase RecG
VISQFGEDRRIERKPSRIDPRQLGDYFSICANTQPHGGVIFLGVTDDGEIEGCSSLDPKRRDELEQAGRTYCADARYIHKNVPVYNKQGEVVYVIAFRVFYRKDKLVANSKGDAWIRIGSSRKKLSELEKREIRISRGEIDHEQEDCGFKWPSDFDLSLIDQYVLAYISARKLTYTRKREDILAVSNLGRTNDKSGFIPNIACALLFAQNPRTKFPGCYIRFLRYQGIHEKTGKEYNVEKDIWIDQGSVPRLIVEAEEMISEQLRTFTRLGKDGRFHRLPEYPRDAWLEAVVNALVHRSYNFKNIPVTVKMFDDRLVIESPGGFPPPTTAETIYGAHNPRNPHLMGALFFLDFVKCAHEGSQRMRDTMEEASLPPPLWEQKDLDGHLVRVTLRNEMELRREFIDASIETPISAELFKSLSDREKILINAAVGGRIINVTEAAMLLEVNWRTAKKVLDKLEARELFVGIAKSTRNPKSGYKLKEQAEG